MEAQISTKVVRSLEGLKEIAEAWRSWQRHPNSDLNFCLTIIRSRQEILRPHVIVVYKDEIPQAMLVGRLEEKKVAIQVGYRTLFRVPARVLTFIYEGLLGNPSPEDCELIVREVVKSLREGEADAALIANLKVDSPLYRFAKIVPRVFVRDLFPFPRAHWTLTVPGSVEELYDGMSMHRRSEIRRKSKRFLAESKGNVEVRCFRGTDDLDRVIRDVEHVACKTYQRGLGVGFVTSAEMRERLRLTAMMGRLRAYVLYIAAAPAAFWIGSMYDEIFHGDYVGYDPAYRKYSPGMFLTLRVIEGFCRPTSQDKVRQIDFGFGDAEYKVALGNFHWDEASVNIFAPTPKGILINVLRSAAMIVDRLLRLGLERIKLIPRTKRAWRTGLSKAQANSVANCDPLEVPQASRTVIP
jgi:hypothetical protein